MTPVATAVLLSGAGSNFLAIADAVAAGDLPLDLRLVAADRPAAGLAHAARRGIATVSLPPAEHATREDHEAALAARIDRSGAELVVLAGYLRVFTAGFVARYAGRLINLHPSLLPAYPGLHTHARALAAGERAHGTSIHFVTAELDGGPLIAQGRLAVRAGDTPESLGARVRAAEHRLYPRVLGWYARGALRCREGLVWLDGLPLAAPVVYDLDRSA